MTMIDQHKRPLRDLRLSVIDACSYRCGYCMPAETFSKKHRFLRRDERLDFGEMLHLTRLFAQCGVHKLRLTGGEPLLRSALPELIRKLKRVGGIDEIAMTTNGYWLSRHAQALRDSGLDRITVSLDSVDPAVYAKMSGRDVDVQRILDAIDLAGDIGFKLKINCVVQRGVNDDSLLQLAERFRGTPHIVRFIEYMDVGTVNQWNMEYVVPSADLVDKINAVYPLEPIDPNYSGEVARRWRYTDGAGEIGVISSITQPFCGGCTRARVSAAGKLYTCLFAADGIDLRGPLRDGATDDDLTALIRQTWEGRMDRYSADRTSESGGGKKVEMYHIGG
jgi:cyclic pyranopterin phosphate synthase